MFSDEYPAQYERQRDEARVMALRAARKEDETRKREEEIERREEEVKRREEMLQRREQELQRREQETRRKEQEAKEKEQEVKRKEEEVKKKEEVREKEEEAGKPEEEAQQEALGSRQKEALDADQLFMRLQAPEPFKKLVGLQGCQAREMMDLLQNVRQAGVLSYIMFI